ncbi:MAG: uncharacterized protein QOG27_112 [Verrucomicrobiota bacterium]
MSVVGTIESLWRYPVKSMKGEELEEMFVGYGGVYGDRLYAFTTSENAPGFPWFTGRDRRQMILYRPRFRHPDKAARPVNLAEAQKHNATPLSASESELMLDVETPDGKVYAIDDPGLAEHLRAGLDQKHELTLHRSDRALADARPLSLFSVQTVAALADESGTAIDKRQFRANIYLDLPKTGPFAEEQLIGRSLRLGSKLVVTPIDRDGRCMMITLHPDSAEKSPNVLKTVAQDHGGFAGLYSAVVTEGLLRKGDPVELLD